MANYPDDKRTALEKLRRFVLKALPGSVDGVSYAMPAIFLDGKAVVAYAAAKKFCSLYPMSGRIPAAFKADLPGYSMTKGSIHFTPEKPIPAPVLRRILKARLAEMKAKAARPKRASR